MKILRICAGHFFLCALLLACGEVTVNVDESTYVPKIVVDGILQPGKDIENIRITRNYALNTRVNVDEIVLDQAAVRLKEVGDDTLIHLTYNPVTLAFECAAGDSFIDCGRSYTLFAEATVDGVKLSTSSTTTVPLQGFEIVENLSLLEPLAYRERDEHGELKKFTIAFKRSPDIDSYIISIVAVDASKETFIEENILGITQKDLDADNLLGELQHTCSWTQTQLGDGVSELSIEWFSLWFYGRYRAVLYAADKNFSDYFLTHRFVQDVDGNLWEPKFHFEGEGIGLFGSAIADTVYFIVEK